MFGTQLFIVSFDRLRVSLLQLSPNFAAATCSRCLSELVARKALATERGLGFLVVFLCVPGGCILIYEIVQIRKGIRQKRVPIPSQLSDS